MGQRHLCKGKKAADLSVMKSFVKGEALCLLRTNSVEKSVELKKKEFSRIRLIEQGCPQDLVEEILAELQFSSRNTQTKRKHLERFCRSLQLSTLLTRILKRFL